MLAATAQKIDPTDAAPTAVPTVLAEGFEYVLLDEGNTVAIVAREGMVLSRIAGAEGAELRDWIARTGGRVASAHAPAPEAVIDLAATAYLV